MSLKSLSDFQLVQSLKTKVENERKLLMEILHALREVEIRKLHLEMGYPDLYEFAMKELGYSSGSAYRRIAAMRLLQSVPEIASKLESGELGLENASQAQSFFRKEDQRRKEQGEQKLSLCEKREVVSQLLGKSTREGQRILIDQSPDVMMPTEKLRVLPEQKTLVQFVASAQLMEKLDELKHLLAHITFEGKIHVLVEESVNIALSKLRPKGASRVANTDIEVDAVESDCQSQSEAKALSSSTSNQVITASPAPGLSSKKTLEAKARSEVHREKMHSRYIPAVQRRIVLLRDKNGCTYNDPKSGRVCGSRHGLQLDHIVPHSLGGQNTAQNLTLKCGAHNRFLAEQMGLFRLQ